MWPETEKCILPEWLKHFFRIFCTITIQKSFRGNLSMRFGLWWEIKKWERKMCFFDHSFAHIFFVFDFVAKPMLELRENMMFFRTVFKSSNYKYLSRRKVLFFAAPEVMLEFSAAWYLSIVSQAAEATYIPRWSVWIRNDFASFASWKVAPEL